MDTNQDKKSPFDTRDEAETFEIALGKTKYMGDDYELMEDKRCNEMQQEELLQENDLETDHHENKLNEGNVAAGSRCCCPQINPTLLVYKGFYFFFLAAIGALLPFLAVFYKQLWMSAKQTGILLGIVPLIKVVAIPLWGVLVDFYKRSKFIFILSIIAWLVAYYSISLVSPVFRQSLCQDNSSVTLAENVIDDLTVDLKSPFHIPNHTHSQTDTIRHVSKDRKNATNFMVEKHSDDDINSKTAQQFLRKLRLKLRKGKHHSKTELISEILSIMESEANSSAAMNITGISKAFNREKLERVFDFLNMQGHYPWPLDTIVDYKGTRESEEWEQDHNNYIFTVLFVITAIGTLLSSPTLTLADIATLQNLGDNKQNYGKQRLWGSFGYGVGAFVVGACISTIQEVKGCNNPLNVDYMPCFYTFAILMGIAVLIGGLFDFDDTQHEDQSMLQGLSNVVCNCEYIYFIFTISFCGCATGIIETFLFWHLEDIGGTQFLYSCIAALQCASEIVVYCCSGTLITHFGHHRILYAGLICYTIRFLGYAFITNSWSVLPLELLHGITNAGIWAASVVFVGLTPRAPSTMQGILGGVYFGLGCGGGGILGGFIVGTIGCPYMFLILAISSFVIFVMFILINNCTAWHCCHRDNNGQAEEYSPMEEYEED